MIREAEELLPGPRWVALLRAAVSASILAFILSRVSATELVARATGAALAPLAAAVPLVLGMAVLVAARWRLLAAWLGLALPMGLSVRAVFLGLFGGQALPSALGTDLLRGWVVVQRTGRLRTVAASLIADRLVALFAACLLVLLSRPSLSALPAPLDALFAPAAVLLSGAALAAFLLRRKDRVPRPGPVAGAVALALAVQATAVAVAALAARAYGIDAGLEVWLAIVPLSVIACAVPVSINGWGVREAVLVALATAQGIAQVDALLVSLTLGLLNMVASLPGAYLLVRQRQA